MATTSLWRVKGYIGKLILYASNPEKTKEQTNVETGNDDTDPEQALGDVLSYAGRNEATESQEYVHGINCGVKSAKEDMMTIKRKFNKLGGVVAYHGYQSFAEGEVTPDEAHEIGKALAEELWGDEFQVLVTTHLDKESHIHNHFVINTVSKKDGHKFHRTKEDYYRMREVSDRLCREHGLSVISKPADKGMNYSEWRAEQEGVPTLRSSIRSAIDLAIKCSITKQQFINAMTEMGFIIDESGKHARIKHIGTERFVRFRSLGEGYSIEEIIKRIYNNKEPAKFELPKQDDPQNVFEGEDEPVRIMTYIPLFRSYNRAIKIAKERPHYNFRIYYLVRQDFSAQRLYEDTLDLLVDHNLKTAEDVIRYKAEAMRQIDENIRLRNEARNHLKRAERARDLVEADKARFNINVYSMTLSKLRREVTTCDEVLERSRHVRDNLTVIEQEKFKGKAGVVNEHISGRGGSSRKDEPKRS